MEVLKVNVLPREDAEVPGLAVQGLNEATRKAREVGAIVVIRGEQLVKIGQCGTIEVLRTVPNRRTVPTRMKKIKR